MQVHVIAGFDDQVKRHPPIFTRLYRPTNPRRRRQPWPRKTWPLGFTVLTAAGGEVVLKVKTPSSRAKVDAKAPADLFTGATAGLFKAIVGAHNRFGAGLRDSVVRSLAAAGCRTVADLLAVEALRGQLRVPGEQGARISDGCAVALARAGCTSLADVQALDVAGVEAMPVAFGVEVARCLFNAKAADLSNGTTMAVFYAGCRTRDDVLAHGHGGAATTEERELAAFKAQILEGQLRSAAGNGDVAKVKEMLAEGVDLKACDDNGKTAYDLAVEGSHTPFDRGRRQRCEEVLELLR
jgi:hypothetical protein